MAPVNRVALIALVGLAASSGCGNSSSSTPDEAAVAQSFRIPQQGTPPLRREAEVKARWDGHGLLGPEPKVVMPEGSPPDSLAQRDLIQGIGHLATDGNRVVVQYVRVAYPTGKKLDSSWRRGKPFAFTLGAGEVMRGWEEGVAGMEVGDRRELVIPPKLAEGPPRGTASRDSTLVFVIDLLQRNEKRPPRTGRPRESPLLEL
jgi:peptidylprolyl isomerase